MSDKSVSEPATSYQPEPEGQTTPASDSAAEQTCLHSEAGHSILHTLDQKLSHVPRVSLRDEVSQDAATLLPGQSSQVPLGKRDSDSRYQLQGEIARGGMGAILKGRDNDLGRELAIKVLLDSHKDNANVVRRFLEEAQIGGQLQHPGIVPVYELGQFADDRPFFSMKLVKGQTLSSFLRKRQNLAEDRTRFLGIFQQVCQTLAYAHSRGVIHRDLKPANIMVGAFGEVQVMDWGLAKVLRPGAETDSNRSSTQQEESIIRTVHADSVDGTPSSDNQTVAGSVLGTPAYMAPEQALGEVDRLDERADVFGLGAILCEILTGNPPYTGKNATEIIRLATRGKLDDCLARLRACGAGRELVTLARQCLASEPEDRPRHAGVVAERMSAYLTSVESRLRAAEIERASAAARAEEALHTVAEAEAKTRAERRARRWQVGLAVVVLTLTGLGGIVALWAAMYQGQLKQEALLARESESRQRQVAETEKKRADLTLADMQTSRGLLAGQRNAPAEAVLWFAKAAAQAGVARDSRRQEQNQLRARNWMRQATLPVAVLSLAGSPAQMEFQPGGDLLLVRNLQGRVFLWSWREGTLLPWTDKLPTSVSACCFSPDGASLALGFRSGNVQIRMVKDGQPVAKTQHAGEITALAYSRDGQYLAIGSHAVRIYDTRGKAFLGPVWKHPQRVNALLFTRQGDRLISACADELARVFAVPGQPEDTAPLYAPLAHAPKMPSPPALIDGERTLVTISGKSELTRWDLATGKPLPPAPLHVKPWGLQKVVASPDGKWFATGGYYGPEVHAADSNRTSLHLSHTNLARNFAFSPDSTLLLSVSWDQTARLWSLPDGQPVGEPLAHMGTVEHCAWSTDARQVATAQADGLIRIWQRPVEKLVVARLDNWGHRPRLSFDGRLVAQGYWHEVSIRFENQRVNRLRVLGASDGKPAGADIPLPGMLVDSCICGDNRTVAAVWSRGETGQLGVWEVASSRPLFEPITLPGLPSSVAARPASGQLAVLCSTGDLLVIDSHTGKTLLSLRHQGWAADNPHRARVEYTADGKTLVSLGDGGNSTLNVWDANTGQLRFPPVRPVLENGAICRGFALSADSKLLATIVNSQNAAQVWDLATGRPLSQPLPHPGDHFGLFSVSFSPDGRHLITGSKDGQVRYWDWQAGKLACPPLVHADEVYDVLITADGRYALTTVRGQQLLQVWELTSGRRMAPPVRLDSQPGVSTQTLALTPDGRRVLVGFRPGDLAVVDLEALLSPPTTPAKNLALWAELATAQRIEVGDLSGLTKEQWLGRWNTLRANTQLVRSSVTGTWLTTALDAWRRQAAAAAQARGNEYARRGQWSQAAKEALAEVAAHPENRLLWSKAAPRLILAGEVEGPQGYRQLCQRMIEQFHSTTSDEQADSLCKVCLLLPDSADRAKLPSRVLLDAVEGEIAKPYYRSWFYACLGLIAYRDGKFQQAADHTARSLAINNRRGPDGALALLVQAMAQQQLKQADLARQTLAEATALIPEELATLGSPEFKGSLPVNSNVVGSDWLIAEVLRREAALLIHNDASRLLDAATLRSRGLQLYQQGKLDEALAALQKANELEKRHAWAHNLVGMIHLRQGQVDQAMAEFRQAIDFAPDYPPPYINLGVTLSNQGKLQEASTLLQQAIAQDATIAVTQRLLGVTLLRQGKLEEAATHLSKALELDGQDARTIQMHAEVTRLRALLPKLDQYVQGTLKPSDADQRLDLARLCFYRQRFAASARFYADTLSDPKGTGEPKPGQRYNAACAAARASQGAGDAASLDAAQRSHWRKQAIAWLRAELDAATRDLARSTAAERFWVLRRLQIWKVDADLASLRDADQIRKLPKDEQMLLATLWSDLDNALKGTP